MTMHIHAMSEIVYTACVDITASDSANVAFSMSLISMLLAGSCTGICWQ